MGIFDMVTGIILVFFFLRGLKNGFIFELASVVALVLGIVAAVLFSDVVGHWLSAFITTRFISVLSFFIVLIGVVIAIKIIANILDRLVKAVALGWLNRLLGALFGTLKAALVLSVFLLILNVFGLSEKWFVEEKNGGSYLYNPLEALAPKALDLINVKVDHLLPNMENFSPLDIISTYN